MPIVDTQKGKGSKPKKKKKKKIAGQGSNSPTKLSSNNDLVDVVQEFDSNQVTQDPITLATSVRKPDENLKVDKTTDGVEGGPHMFDVSDDFTERQGMFNKQIGTRKRRTFNPK